MHFFCAQRGAGVLLNISANFESGLTSGWSPHRIRHHEVAVSDHVEPRPAQRGARGLPSIFDLGAHGPEQFLRRAVGVRAAGAQVDLRACRVRVVAAPPRGAAWTFRGAGRGYSEGRIVRTNRGAIPSEPMDATKLPMVMDRRARSPARPTQTTIRSRPYEHPSCSFLHRRKASVVLLKAYQHLDQRARVPARPNGRRAL